MKRGVRPLRLVSYSLLYPTEAVIRDAIYVFLTQYKTMCNIFIAAPEQSTYSLVETAGTLCMLQVCMCCNF